MASLTIHLLGTPEVRVGEQLLHLRTRKVLALLIYLAVRLFQRENILTRWK